MLQLEGMAQVQNPETPHERRVTWSLMAAVVAFVFLMTCIVLWITTSLIRQELGGASEANPTGIASPSDLPASATPAPPTATATTVITETVLPGEPVLLDTTWTPIPGKGRYVTFNYWYVKPNRIHAGECIRLTWETENAVSLTLYRNGELYIEEAPPAATLQDCPNQPGYTVYRLLATSPAGESNWIQLQVKVDEPP